MRSAIGTSAFEDFSSDVVSRGVVSGGLGAVSKESLAAATAAFAAAMASRADTFSLLSLEMRRVRLGALGELLRILEKDFGHVVLESQGRLPLGNDSSGTDTQTSPASLLTTPPGKRSNDFGHAVLSSQPPAG